MAHRYKRGKTWWVEYYLNGKQVHKSLKTKDDAVARYLTNEIENDILRGENPLPKENITVSQVYEEYQSYLKNRIAESTIATYRSFIVPFIKQLKSPYIGNIHESSVTNYISNKFKTDKITPRTANHILKYVKTMLSFAKSRNYIKENPLEKVKLYRIEKSPPKFLDKSEIAKILTAAKGETLCPMIATALYTGMRLGELKRLKKEDVDLKRGIITVMLSKSRKFRTIPIHKDLKDILSIAALPFDTSNIRRVFKRIQRNAGVAGIGWHTFRHTFASHLTMNGVDLVTVGKYLGHADISTTTIYSHLSQSHVNQAIDKLGI